MGTLLLTSVGTCWPLVSWIGRWVLNVSATLEACPDGAFGQRNTEGFPRVGGSAQAQRGGGVGAAWTIRNQFKEEAPGPEAGSSDEAVVSSNGGCSGSLLNTSECFLLHISQLPTKRKNLPLPSQQ